MDRAGAVGIVLRIAFDRILALDQMGIVARRAREDAARLADARILLEIVGQVDRRGVGTGMLVAHFLAPAGINAARPARVLRNRPHIGLSPARLRGGTSRRPR